MRLRWLPNEDGMRTWRLAIAFFLGVGVSLVLLDSLIVESSSNLGHLAVGIAAWPLVHFVAVGILAYLRPLARCFGGFSPARRGLVLVVLICAYAAAAAMSLWSVRG